MNKVTMLSGIFSLLLPLTGMAYQPQETDLNAVSFKGATSCIVYLAESGDKNFGILCDGHAITLLQAPSRKVLGPVSFEGLKKAYTNYMNTKCSEAGLNGRTLFNTNEFWGIICHK